MNKCTHVHKCFSQEAAQTFEEDLPDGSKVGNLPANSGDKGSRPVPGRFQLLLGNWAYVQQLSPQTLELVLCNKRSHHKEKSVYHNSRGAPAPKTRESLHAATKTSAVQNKQINQ